MKSPRTQSLRREFAGAPISGSRLRYLPLGGLGEVGINMWALEWQDQVLVIDAGLTFVGYSEGLPAVGYSGCSSGRYAAKHSPWVNFSNVPAANSVPFSSFPSD